MVNIIPENFSAYIDKQPPGPHKLIVKGTITVPTGGWSASLTPAVPQGINPAIIILDLKLSRPSGDVTQAFKDIEARYTESPPKHPYTDATIRHADGEFTIPVKTVQ